MTSRRYQFDTPLPAPRQDSSYPPVHQPQPVSGPAAYDDTGRQVVVQHIHQAPPDRTTQRIALGTGIGAGTVAAGVYFGPLLVAALSSMAISLAVVALVAVAAAWGVTTVVRSIGGPDGKQAAETVAKVARRRR